MVISKSGDYMYSERRHDVLNKPTVESSRKLATIQQIADVVPIAGADRIEMVVVKGWECVARKGEFKVGSLCVFFEIDSILPAHPVFEFLEPRNYRIKTARFMGQISQGLVLPLDSMTEAFKLPHMQLGSDVTGLIRVLKYDPQIAEELSNSTKNKDSRLVKLMMRYSWFRLLRLLVTFKSELRPNFIPKTDEERVQNMPNVASRHYGTRCYYTEKLDGTSASYCLDPSFGSEAFKLSRNFYVCSRNKRLLRCDDSVYWRVANQYRLRERFMQYAELYGTLIIQGEIIGSKIQGNKYGIDDGVLLFYVFNIMRKSGRRLPLNDRLEVCESMGLTHVPILDRDFVLNKQSVGEMVKLTHGNSELNNVKREGIVIRSDDESLSFKVVNPEFLLEHDE